MDISQIRYFISAANIGSFTMAALENNISQSSFSKQIMNLEGELGTKLFLRRQRHIELTEAGAQFRIYALQMLQDYNEMLRGMESYSESQTLPVSICAIPVWQPYRLGQIIFDLQKKYPDIILRQLIQEVCIPPIRLVRQSLKLKRNIWLKLVQLMKKACLDLLES